MGKVREVSFEEAGLAVVAASVAAGPAPRDGAQRAEWMGRVGSLARDLGGLVKDVRLDIMRTVKVIPVEGVLDLPRAQNNPNRVNFTIDTGGRYPDTLWTDFLEGAALDRERNRLKALVGKRVRLVKVTEIDFDKDGEVKLDDKGSPEQRSFARGGEIHLVDEEEAGAPAAPVAPAPARQAAAPQMAQPELPVSDEAEMVSELDAKRELIRACLGAGLPGQAAKERAKAVYDTRLSVVDGEVSRASLDAAVELAGHPDKKVA
ncbi:MAG: hypothetical protein ACYDGR_09785 [Candidatus Dormibacteria bacterium]